MAPMRDSMSIPAWLSPSGLKAAGTVAVIATFVRSGFSASSFSSSSNWAMQASRVERRWETQASSR